MTLERQRVATLDISGDLDTVLEHAFAGSEFVIDRCGSEVALLHKLRSAPPFLILFENKRPIRPEPIFEILDAARERSVPMLLVSEEPLPPERVRVLSYLLGVLTPPIHPMRLYREVKSFQWREETVYIMRMASKRARSVVVVHLDPLQVMDADHLGRFRAFFEQHGNKFVSASKPELAAQFLAKQERSLLLLSLPDADPERLVLYDQVHGSALATTVLLPDSACTAANVAPYLLRKALTVLPESATKEDLDELYDLIRFLRPER